MWGESQTKQGFNKSLFKEQNTQGETQSARFLKDEVPLSFRRRLLQPILNLGIKRVLGFHVHKVHLHNGNMAGIFDFTTPLHPPS